MEIGLRIRYGKFVPGYETRAVELFDESSRYYREKVERGELTSFEPFLLSTSDLEEEMGFFILKGPAPEIFRMIEEDAFVRLVQKAMVLLEHVRWDLLTVGEGITEQIERFAKVRAELGI